MKTGQFLEGVKDCRDGIPHSQSKCPEYNRGYSWEYERQQLVTVNSERQENA